MKAITIRRPGGHARLELLDRVLPPPAMGELRVRVAAAGVNFADTAVRMGLYKAVRDQGGYPVVPGFEFAGRVEAVGSDCAGWSEKDLGAEVFGVTRFGAYAEEVNVPASQVFRRPASLSANDGAAFPAIWLTAWYALQGQLRLRPGARILVHSAAGGVGGALACLGRELGLHVTGIVRGPHKVEVARLAGCHEVIDKDGLSSRELWRKVEQASPTGGVGFDAVFDANGRATMKESYRHVRPGGFLVIYGFASFFPREGGRPNWLKIAWDFLATPRFHPVATHHDNVSLVTFNLSLLFGREDLLREAMSFLLPLLERGALKLPRVTTYPLGEAARAHADIEGGRTVGKLILVPDGR